LHIELVADTHEPGILLSISTLQQLLHRPNLFVFEKLASRQLLALFQSDEAACRRSRSRLTNESRLDLRIWHRPASQWVRCVSFCVSVRPGSRI